MASRPPPILAGKYRLTSLLGRGGMGTVWRAEHLGFDAPVAVKLIDAKVLGSADALRRFHNEARAAAALRSPHVVQVLDYGVDEATGSPFIAMELLEGESLSDRLRRLGRMPPVETVRVITHVARALARAHESGIVHRDLKPSNIFLVRNDDEEIAKVLDFGTARVAAPVGGGIAEPTTAAGAVIGTPHYMSPEQITGAKVDYRTDLWALAVIAWECLLGRRLFQPGDIGHLVLHICTYPLPRPSELGPVPAGFDDLCVRALDRDPARRFQSARGFADELRRVCGEPAGVVAGRAPPPPATVEMNPPTLPTPQERAAPAAAVEGRRPGVRAQAVAAGAVVVVIAVAGVMGLSGLLRRGHAPDAAPPAPVTTPETVPAPPAAVQPQTVPPDPGTPATPPPPTTAPAVVPPPPAEAHASKRTRHAVRRHRARDRARSRGGTGGASPAIESVLDQRR